MLQTSFIVKQKPAVQQVFLIFKLCQRSEL